MPPSKLRIFTGNSNCPLAQRTCNWLGVKLARARVEKLKNGECDIEILDSVREADVFVIQSGFGDNSVNDSLMELCILIQACRMSAARRIVAVLPYYPYSKQSKKKGKRRGIPAKFVADMLKSAGASQVVVLDIHAPQIQGFFDIPVDSLYIEPFIIKYIQENISNSRGCVILAKNAGGAKRCTSVAHKLHCNFALIHEEFCDDDEDQPKDPHFAVIGDVANRDVIILDDMMDGVGTFVSAADTVKKNGATKVYCIVTHGIFAGNALERLEASHIDEIITTNTITQEDNLKRSSKLKVIDISPLITEAVRRINYGESLAFLGKNVPL